MADASNFDGIDPKTIRKFKRTLHRMDAEIRRDVIRQAVLHGVPPILNEARRRAPVADERSPASLDYGPLKPNVKADMPPKAQRPYQAVVNIGVKKLFYASFGEFGTKHQPARPWLRPAYDAKWREGARRAIKKFTAWLRVFTRRHGATTT